MDFGFVGPAYEAPSITQDDQELINWYPEIDPTKNAGTKAMNVAGDRGVIALYPCPGIVSRSQPLANVPVRGFHVVTAVSSTLYAACGASVYSINTSYNATLIGTLSTSSGPVVMTDNGISLYITDGTSRYSYTWGTSTFATMTDGAFLGATVCDEADNYIVYNRAGTNQWGCTNAGSVVSGALNLGQKIGSADSIASLIADHRDIWLLGDYTSEVWSDAGTFPFPYQAIPGTMMQHGCAAAYSVARLGESFAWLSRDTRGQGVVVHTTGYSPQRISTHAVETSIKDGVIADAVAFTYQQAGHEFYVLSFPTQDKTWVYDLATQMWHKRAWRDSYGALHRHRANCSAVFNGEVIVGDWQNGNIYAFSQSVYTDNGATLLRRRRCPHITQELNRVFHHSLQIQFQPGVGLSAGQGSDPQVILRWSDDGGHTWGNDHFLTIGKIGKYKNRAIKRQLGEARDRVYEVDITDPINAVVVSANLMASAGAA